MKKLTLTAGNRKAQYFSKEKLIIRGVEKIIDLKKEYSDPKEKK
jgi:hypothetical protein